MKSVVVKALVLLVVEARLFFFPSARRAGCVEADGDSAQAAKYPWQPNVDITFPVLTPRIRSLFVVRS